MIVAIIFMLACMICMCSTYKCSVDKTCWWASDGCCAEKIPAYIHDFRPKPDIASQKTLDPAAASEIEIRES